jgi:hypothetical protein
VGRSCHERAVSDVCAKVVRPDEELFRARVHFVDQAMRPSQPDTSILPRRTAALRAEVARPDKRRRLCFARYDKTRKEFSCPYGTIKHLEHTPDPSPTNFFVFRYEFVRRLPI